MLADALSTPSSIAPTSTVKTAQPVVLRMTSTMVFYEAVAAALGSEQVIWDFGCGNGLGVALLRAEGRQVIGIDPDLTAAPEIANNSNELRFCSGLEEAAQFGAPDVIVIADVLGYLQNPVDTLLELARLSKPTTQLVIFEQRANVTQQLPLNKNRAYSTIELLETTTMGGWANQTSHELCQTFVALSAERAPAPAIEALRSCIPTTFPDSPQLSAATHLAAAAEAMRTKNGEHATQLFISALHLVPTNIRALCGLARFAQLNQSPHEALQLLRQSLALDPTNQQAMQLWLEFVAANAPQDLLATCQSLVNLAPTDLEALTLLAQLHAEGGNIELAIQDLELIRKQQPVASVDLSITLAWLLHSAGRTADAQVEARLANVLAPDNPDVAELLVTLAA